jgi:hypothetical protein
MKTNFNQDRAARYSTLRVLAKRLYSCAYRVYWLQSNLKPFQRVMLDNFAIQPPWGWIAPPPPDIASKQTQRAPYGLIDCRTAYGMFRGRDNHATDTRA